MPDLGALEVLVAVARTGSLNAAAGELGRTQQAVSARVASLEAQTGVTVLDRSPRGSTLTPAGVVVAEWAARLLDQAAEVDAAIAALRQDRDSRLRVAASLTVAERLLPGWLVSLAAVERARGAAPAAVTLAATNSAEVASLVRAGRVDLGFVEGPSAPRGCRSRVVGHDRLVAVVAPGHPWATRRRPVDAETLVATPLVTRERGSGTRDALDAALGATLRDPAAGVTPALELSTTAAVRAAVLAGAAPAVLSALVVADDLAAGRLVEVTVVGIDLGRSLRAVWSGPRTPPAGPVRDLVAVAAARARPAPVD
ncbi:LysR family transcriptional regulator [Jatrophihabitans sp. YIM 134969]